MSTTASTTVPTAGSSRAADVPRPAGRGGLSAVSPAQAQRTFRATLEAMARPGTLHRLLDVPGSHPPVSAVPLALADLMSPLAPLGPAEKDLTAELARITGAPLTAPAEARIVLGTAAPAASAVHALPAGSAWEPERGALLAQHVVGLGTEPCETTDVVLRLAGPGVDGIRHLAVTGIDADVVDARNLRCAAFPAGVDLVLVAADATVAALPRTTRIEVLR
ncbi:phosphonate C-P lyase system protein PhnH [Georgenia deserti]|uniref:Phosphonate C-P lyase system protein PhnH n=1 Tax=Georgenia deserti TaxID=2093781 RepID=A0ABW4L5B8_9MICO